MRPVWPLVLLLAWAAPAAAAQRAADAAGQPSHTTMVLEIWVNGQTDHVVAPVESRDGKLYVAAATLTEAGVPAGSGDQSVALETLAGVTAKIDGATQRLLLTVAADKLPAQRFDLKKAAPAEKDEMGGTPTSGAILRYDAAVNVDDAGHVARSAYAGAAGTLDIFTPAGRLTGSGFANVTRAGFSGARLDTALEFDRQSAMTRLILGDAITGGPGWSRNVRFGGVQYASDFSMRPDLVTMPLPDFFGSSQVPGTVDVFNGATHVFEQDIAPGPFELRNLPIVTGGGTATIVTRDVLGRQTSQTISLYTQPDLLAPGLSAYSFEAGFQRRGYGLRRG